MFPLVIKFWREMLIATLIALLLSTFAFVVSPLRIEVLELQNDINLRKQAEKILSDEYVKKFNQAKEREIITKKEYIDRVQAIYVWGENNASCENGIKYLDNYVY